MSSRQRAPLPRSSFGWTAPEVYAWLCVELDRICPQPQTTVVKETTEDLDAIEAMKRKRGWF